MDRLDWACRDCLTDVCASSISRVALSRHEAIGMRRATACSGMAAERCMSPCVQRSEGESLVA